MKLDCVIVCVDYADFLAHTLPYNRTLFDYVVVVTSPRDKATKKICEYWCVHCVQTEVFYHTEKSSYTVDNNVHTIFNKGKAINEGLKYLPKTDWIVHMDADIYLPPLTRRCLNNMALDKNCIYGIDRVMCKSYPEWQRYISQPPLQHENNVFLHPHEEFPLGVRIVRHNDDGYIPIGFFQLFHSSSKFARYPEQHTNAARTDMAFALQWSKENRRFIPDFYGVHLESEAAKMGVNWDGRKSVPFHIDGGRNMISKNFVGGIENGY